ncbi:MAG: hypothetical protein KIT84_24080 [Labilithrix sp.]|nr:hypothetical protein [Labilithrix sp.]MCW5814129.1 hypothetical protein [Labilithrix sp.]
MVGLLSGCPSETIYTTADGGGGDGGSTIPKRPRVPVDGEEPDEPDDSTEPSPVVENFDIKGTKIAEASSIPIGMIGDDIIIYDTAAKTLLAQPYTGGEATKIADVPGYGATPTTENFRVSGGVVAVWKELNAEFVGKLNVWTREGGLKELDTNSYATLFVGSPDAKRVNYLKDPTFDASTPKKIQTVAVVGMNLDGSQRQALEGTFALNMVASKTCPPQFIPGGAGSLWVKYCLGSSPTVGRARLVLLTSTGPLRVDGIDVNSADTLRGDTPFAPGPLTFAVELSPAETGGKGRLINLQATPPSSQYIEDGVVSGTIIGDQLFWITADGKLKQQKTDLTGTAKELAADAAQLFGASANGQYIGYVQKGAAASVKDVLLDVKTDPAPAPVILGDDAKIPNAIFTSDNKNLLYVANDTYRVRDLAAGAVKDATKPAYGFRAAPNGSALIYTQKTATNQPGTFFYQVGFVPDMVAGGKPQSLTFALATQVYYKESKVIFRYARPAEGGGGIYIADLPTNAPPPPPPPPDAGTDAAP